MLSVLPYSPLVGELRLNNNSNAYTFSIGTPLIGQNLLQTGVITTNNAANFTIMGIGSGAISALPGGATILKVGNGTSGTGTLSLLLPIVDIGGGNTTQVVFNRNTTTGITVVGGTNTYSGGSIFNGGIVQISSDSNLGVVPAAISAGNLTFGGGTLETTASFTLNANRGILLNAAGGTLKTDSGTTLTVNSGITGTGTLTKSGAGTVQLGNTTAGSIAPTAISVNSGTLLMGAANQIATSTSLTLSGGTFATGGFSNTLGVLTLSSTSTIDLGTGASVLAFSSYTSSSGTLTVSNWSGLTTGGGVDQLRFTTSLTALELAQINFTGYAPGASEVNFGTYYEVVPTPEPATLATGFLLILSIYWRRRPASITKLVLRAASPA